MQNKTRVMIIDDSIVFRTWLINSIGNDQRFEVAGAASGAHDAMSKIPAVNPDILTLDIEMPGMSGLDFIKEYLPSHPIPVVLVSSLNMRVFDALAAGAVDYVKKPDMDGGFRTEAFRSALLAKLAAAAQSRVHVPALPSRLLSLARPELAGGTVIAIGASTGGTEAILDVLRQLPANMPSIVITQHMPEGFTSMYAERLNRLCQIEVREARNGDKLRPGLALLAPGGLQMKVVRMGGGYAVHCARADKVNGHCPSVDVLFDSVANTARDKSIGILLTGMGADGAAGLLRMRKNGAYTIGQNKETSVVYGMPMEAHKIGAVCHQSALGAIPQAIINKLNRI